MSASSNPGAATPQSLHRLYRNQAAATANPYVIRNLSQPAVSKSERQFLLGGSVLGSSEVKRSNTLHSRRRTDSPPRAQFRCVSSNFGR